MQGMKCMSCGMHCKKVHLRSQFECGELGIRQSAIDRMKKKENELSNNSTPAQSVEIVDPEGSCKKGNSKPVKGNYRKCSNCGGKMKKYVQHNCPPDENGAILSTIWGSFE